MNDTIDDDESGIIVVSDTTIDNVCDHEVGKEVASDDEQESEIIGAPVSEGDFVN